ncbi:unnamed protein product [Victoria cruziana]
MVETRSQEKKREEEACLQAEHTGAPPNLEAGEASSRSLHSSESESELAIYKQFCKLMKGFNKEHEQKAKQKVKNGKKVKVLTSSSSSLPATSSSDSKSEED